MWDEAKVRKELGKAEKKLAKYTIGTASYMFQEAEIKAYKKVLQMELD
jgi:hypothetical protein